MYKYSTTDVYTYTKTTAIYLRPYCSHCTKKSHFRTLQARMRIHHLQLYRIIAQFAILTYFILQV